jgi:hypothetical protein
MEPKDIACLKRDMKLFSGAMATAEHFLTKNGSLNPFGYALKADGTFDIFGKQPPASADPVPGLRAQMKGVVARGEIASAALVFSVETKDRTSCDEAQALRIELYSKGVEQVTFFILYSAANKSIGDVRTMTAKHGPSEDAGSQ